MDGEGILFFSSFQSLWNILASKVTYPYCSQNPLQRGTVLISSAPSLSQPHSAFNISSCFHSIRKDLGKISDVMGSWCLSRSLHIFLLFCNQLALDSTVSARFCWKSHGSILLQKAMTSFSHDFLCLVPSHEIYSEMRHATGYCTTRTCSRALQQCPSEHGTGKKTACFLIAMSMHIQQRWG